jgi:hypothetical protein
MPMRPLTVPTEAELGLILVAKYETDQNTHSWLARRFCSVHLLIATAVLIFGYDVGSVFLFR